MKLVGFYLFSNFGVVVVINEGILTIEMLLSSPHLKVISNYSLENQYSLGNCNSFKSLMLRNFEF